MGLRPRRAEVEGAVRARGEAGPRRQEDPCRRCSVEDLARRALGEALPLSAMWSARRPSSRASRNESLPGTSPTRSSARASWRLTWGPWLPGRTGAACSSSASKMPSTSALSRGVQAVLVTSGQLRNLDPQLQVPPLLLANTLIAAFSRASPSRSSATSWTVCSFWTLHRSNGVVGMPQ
ncbi:hypothetical protein ZWY2020_044915 [Hordeum vulgare]|nr:hypothetical protein ZWY2020_044915 [Hordeum vulgare]